MLRLLRPKHKNAKIFENHRNRIMLVFIWKLSPSTLRWITMWQGLSHFPAFLHHFVLAKLATSNTRVKQLFASRNYWFLSLQYSLDSSCWVLSDELPCARVSVISQSLLHHLVIAKLATSNIRVYPSNAEATFVQSTRTQSVLKTIETLSCWYSLDSSRWVLSDEYPFPRVSIIFQFFCIILYRPN